MRGPESRSPASPAQTASWSPPTPAFGYLCKEFGLKAIPVQGLNRERDPSPRYLAETIQILRRERARAIFPETLANPKVLAAMVRESAVEVAPGSLIADGNRGRAGRILRGHDPP